MFAALAADDEAQALARLPRDVEAMRKGELMEYAKTLGVETRRESEDGKKNLWRPVSDVKTDCKEAQARHCQLAGPQARTLAPGAGAASASHMNREWGGPLPPGTAGTGEEPSSSRAGVPGTASASPVRGLGTAISDRPHDRAMRELGPDQREWWLTSSGWWWTRRSPEHDWYPWYGESRATWLSNWY